MRRIIAGKKVVIVCIQETKLEVFDQRTVRSLWGCANADFVWVKAVGSAGGLCICWDSNVFKKIDVVFEARFILLKGQFIKKF